MHRKIYKSPTITNSRIIEMFLTIALITK